MFLKDLYDFLSSQSLGVSVYPINVPVDEAADCIVYNLDSITYANHYNERTNFNQAAINFMSISKTAYDAMLLSETLEAAIKNYQGELVTGGTYCQSVDFVDQTTIFDTSANCYAVGLQVLMTYNE